MKPDLNAIEARVNAATPGGWVVHSDDFDLEVRQDPTVDKEGWGHITIATCIQDAQDNDAEFIAHARQDVPDLIAYARELEARVAELESENWVLQFSIRRMESLGYNSGLGDV